MTINVNYQGVSVPALFITKNRQRVKQYNNVVYLKNGDEFELELFNPTSNKVLAKISLNDISIGSGIVLRPGERVFLERFLNEAKKFIFETYEVDKKDPNVQKAIKDNGKVEVEFYEEQTNNIVWNNPYTYTYTPNPWGYYGDINFSGGSYDGSITMDNNCCSSTEPNLNIENPEMFRCSASIQETGRIEKGSYSDQSFVYDSTQFNVWSSWSQLWKILPKSQKAFVKEELKIFCTKCGAQRKKSSHKFCPHCGSKL